MYDWNLLTDLPFDPEDDSATYDEGRRADHRFSLLRAGLSKRPPRS